MSAELFSMSRYGVVVRRICPTLRQLYLILATCCALFWLVAPVHAKTRFWDGKVSSHWSDASNWSTGFETEDHLPPQNGDELFFETGHNAFENPGPMVNDISNLKIKALYFIADVASSFPGTLDWELDGVNTLTVTEGIHSHFSDSTTDSENIRINCPLKLDGDAKFSIAEEWQTEPTFIFGQDVTLQLNGSIDLNGHTLTLVAGLQSRIEVPSVISGIGDIVAKGTEIPDYAGVIHFSGPEGNTFQGSLMVEPASTYNNWGNNVRAVIFDKQHGVVVNDAVQIGRARVSLNRPEQIGDQAKVTIGTVPNSGGDSSIPSALVLNGHNETIGSLAFVSSPSDMAGPLLDTGTAQLTVLGDIASFVTNAIFTPKILGHLAFPETAHTITAINSGYAALDLDCEITGSRLAQLFVRGNAAVILGGANSYLGEYFVGDSAILEVSNDHALNGGDVTLQGSGSLTLSAVSVSATPLNIEGGSHITPDTTGSLLTTIGSCSWGGSVRLSHDLVVAADNFSVVGQISGTGGIEFINGRASISGSLPNSFTGRTLVRGARLDLEKPAGINAFAGSLVVGGGFGDQCEVRWLNGYQGTGTALTVYSNGVVNLNNHNEDFGPVVFNGGEVKTGTGQFAFYQPMTVNPVGVPAVINGFLGLPPPGNAVFDVGNGGAEPDLLVNAVVFGAAEEVIKQGPGSMRFGGANTYSGVTQVNEGVLEITDNNALGGPNPTIVRTNATLQFRDNIVVSENIKIEGKGGDQGALSIAENGIHASLKGTLTLLGPAIIDAGGPNRTVDLSGLEMGGPIVGNGTLTKLGNGSLTFDSQVVPNSYVGDTVVVRGILYLITPPGTTAIPGKLIIGTGAFNTQPLVDQSSSFNIVGSVTVDRGGIWHLEGAEGFSIPDLHGEPPLTLRNGGSVRIDPTGALYLPVGGDVVVAPGTTGHSSIVGNIGLDPGPHHFIVGSDTFGSGGPEFTVDARVSQTSTAADLVKDGTGTMILTASNSYSGNTVVASGVLQVEGTQTASSVQVNAGILQGAGAVGPLVLGTGSGTVAPRISAGILTCDNFSAASVGGVLQIQLNGPKASTGYDQLRVRGVCNLSGVTLKASLNYSASANDQFIIIQTSGTDDPVQGTFNGLPEGSLLSISGVQFRITYQGGDGTDVVLNRVAQFAAGTSVWAKGTGGDWNDPQNWNTFSVPNGGNAAVTNISGFAITITNLADADLNQFYYDDSLANITGSGNFTIADILQWHSGSFSGSGSISANGGLRLSGSASSTAKSFAGKTLINSQNASWIEDGMLMFSAGAVLSNTTGATFVCIGDGAIQNGSGGGHFENSGVFAKNGGSNTTLIQIPFDNFGTVQVQSGTLALNGGGTNSGTILTAPGTTIVLGGGNHEFTAGSSLGGQGNFATGPLLTTAHFAGDVNLSGSNIFNSGTVDFVGTYLLSDSDLSIGGGTVNFDGAGKVDLSSLTVGPFGTLGGSNLVTVNGPMVWNGSANIQGSNSVIANGGLTINQGGVFLQGRTLINNSAALWTNFGGVVLLSKGAVLSNAPGSTFDINGGGEVQSSGSNTFANLGLLRKSGPTNETRISAPFNSGGAVDVQSGLLTLNGDGDFSTGAFRIASGAILNLSGGAHNLGPSSTISGDGDLRVSGDMANLAGAVSLTGTHSFSGGTANITGNYNALGNLVNISGGTANFNGSGLITPAEFHVGAFGTLGGAQPIVVSGPLTLGPQSTLTGSNTITAGGALSIQGDLVISGRTLINKGNAHWTNSGNGSIALLNGGVLSNAPGALFEFAGNGSLGSGVGGGVVVNAGTFRKLPGSGSIPNTASFVNTGTLEIQSGNFAFGGDATFTQQDGVTHLVGGTLSSATPVQIAGGELSGKGTVAASVINSGRIRPGTSRGTADSALARGIRALSSDDPSPGDIIIAGDYTQTADGVLDIELSGTNYNRLVVSNAVHLGGTLNITLTNNFSPSANALFTLVTGTNLTGTFDAVNTPFQDVRLALQASGTNLVLQVINVRPVIDPIDDQLASVGVPFTLSVHATDADLPAQTLRYTLVTAPEGANIDSTGRINWTPRASQGGANIFTVGVIDNAPSPLSAFQTFQVSVSDSGGAGSTPSSISSIQPDPIGSHSYNIRFSGAPGLTYITEFTTQLPGPWLDLATNLTGADGVWSVTDDAATNRARFYRARSAP